MGVPFRHQNRPNQLGRMVFCDLELFKAFAAADNFAKVLVQPHDHVLFRRRFGHSFETLDRVAHGLATGDD